MLKGARLAYLIESGKSNALGRQDEYVQDMRSNVHDNGGSWKFSGVALPGNRFLQVYE